jgi:hypothetical protein
VIGLAIGFLWFLIGVIVLAGIIWIVLYGLTNIAGIAIPPRLVQGIWFIFLILVLIYALTLIAGGGSGMPFRHWSQLNDLVRLAV